MRVTFSPFTAEPRYVQAVAQAMVQAQMQFAMAAWDAQIRYAGALVLAALAAQSSIVDHLHQAHLRRE